MQITFDASILTIPLFFLVRSMLSRNTSLPFLLSLIWQAQHGASAVERLVTFNLHLPTVTWHSRVVEWINEEFLPENRRRLKAACSYLTGELLSMGIPFLDRPATLYVWADLRKVTRPKSNWNGLHMNATFFSFFWDIYSLGLICHFCFGSISKSHRLRRSCLCGSVSSGTRCCWVVAKRSAVQCLGGSASSLQTNSTTFSLVSTNNTRSLSWPGCLCPLSRSPTLCFSKSSEPLTLDQICWSKEAVKNKTIVHLCCSQCKWIMTQEY